jgi:hypothetical protein
MRGAAADMLEPARLGAYEPQAICGDVRGAQCEDFTGNSRKDARSVPSD